MPGGNLADFGWILYNFAVREGCFVKKIVALITATVLLFAVAALAEEPKAEETEKPFVHYAHTSVTVHVLKKAYKKLIEEGKMTWEEYQAWSENEEDFLAWIETHPEEYLMWWAKDCPEQYAAWIEKHPECAVENYTLDPEWLADYGLLETEDQKAADTDGE